MPLSIPVHLLRGSEATRPQGGGMQSVLGISPVLWYPRARASSILS